jgi:hypothetical protein
MKTQTLEIPIMEIWIFREPTVFSEVTLHSTCVSDVYSNCGLSIVLHDLFTR